MKKLGWPNLRQYIVTPILKYCPNQESHISYFKEDAYSCNFVRIFALLMKYALPTIRKMKSPFIYLNQIALKQLLILTDSITWLQNSRSLVILLHQNEPWEKVILKLVDHSPGYSNKLQRENPQIFTGGKVNTTLLCSKLKLIWNYITLSSKLQGKYYFSIVRYSSCTK